MALHHCALLAAINRNAHKFRGPSLSQMPSIVSNDRFQEEFATTKLLDYQERFESQLLILVKRKLTPKIVSSLSLGDSQRLEYALDELFKHLDGVTNDDFLIRRGDSQTTATTTMRMAKPSFHYPRLDRTIYGLDSLEAFIELSGRTELSLFRILTIEDARRAHALVVQVERILKQCWPTTAMPPTQGKTIPEKDSQNREAFDQWIGAFGKNSYDCLGELLDRIEEDFGACDESAHGIRIQLLHHEEPNWASGGTLVVGIYCPRMADWRVASCEIDTELHGQRYRRPLLCEHLRRSPANNENPSILFHLNTNFFSRNPNTADNEHRLPSTSLHNLITSHDYFGLPVIKKRFKAEERRVLAAQLALHLSMFWRWKHSSAPWDSKAIHFLQCGSGNIKKNTPLIGWQFGKDLNEDLTEDEESEAMGRSFALFAKLLLEIEYGKIPNTEYALDEPNLYGSLREYVQELRKTADPITHGRYLEAVDACLHFHLAYEKARLYQELSKRIEEPEEPIQTYRRLFHGEIASNILMDLLDLEVPVYRSLVDDASSEHSDYFDESDFEFLDEDEVLQYPDTHEIVSNVAPVGIVGRLSSTVSGLQAWSRNFTPLGISSNPAGNRNPRASPELVQPNRSPIQIMRPLLQVTLTETPAPSPAGVRGASSAIALQEQQIDQVGRDEANPNIGRLLDYNSEIDVIGAQRRRTDAWFHKFIGLVEALEINSPAGDPVKVAILDSGCHMGNEDFNDAEKLRIKETTSFVDNDPNTDIVGHGTYMAAIILRLTVNVHLYIGKLTTSDRTEKASLVKAMKHAREVWKVDMISISSGFERSTPTDGLQAQVNLCTQASITVFASASNDGAEGTRTYPAKFQEVICVHASNENGISYQRNPLPEGDAISGLSFIGEQIRPIWGRDDLKGSTKMEYRSGTSYATPVAVSFAATMLGLIRKKGWASWPWMHSPWTPRGMEYILRMMSQSTEVYRWVTPTKYFETTSMATFETVLRERLVRDNFRAII